MSDTHTVLHDPYGPVDAAFPLDRAPHEALVTAVLGWKDPDLEPRDYEQIALQLAGHARAVAADVQRHAAALPKNDGRGVFAEVASAKPPAASPSRYRAPPDAPRIAPGSYGPSTNAWTLAEDLPAGRSRPPLQRPG